jgi:hypothetical protein
MVTGDLDSFLIVTVTAGACEFTPWAPKSTLVGLMLSGAGWLCAERQIQM